MKDKTGSALAEIIACALNENGDMPELAADTDAGALFEELCSHTIVGLTGNVMNAVPGMTEELRATWKHCIISQVMSYDRYMYAQRELIEVLDRFGFPYVVLKGSAAGMYYPSPELRAMGDVDLLVKPEDYERAKAALAEAGYEFAHAPENENYDESYRKGNMEVELHWGYCHEMEKLAGESLDEMLFASLPHVRRAEVSGIEVPVLPELENGLTLIAHIGHHISILGFRQVLDWMQYVRRTLHDDFWKESFQAQARKYHLEKLCKVTARMCQLYFGLEETDITWCMDEDEALCRQLFEYVLKAGNFGTKHDGESEHAVARIIQRGGVTGTLKRLQKRGEDNWKALEKHPYLRPVAWLYQIQHYYSHHLQGRDVIGATVEDMTEVRRLQQFWKKLGIDSKE